MNNCLTIRNGNGHNVSLNSHLWIKMVATDVISQAPKLHKCTDITNPCEQKYCRTRIFDRSTERKENLSLAPVEWFCSPLCPIPISKPSLRLILDYSFPLLSSIRIFEDAAYVHISSTDLGDLCTTIRSAYGPTFRRLIIHRSVWLLSNIFFNGGALLFRRITSMYFAEESTFVHFLLQFWRI